MIEIGLMDKNYIRDLMFCHRMPMIGTVQHHILYTICMTFVNGACRLDIVLLHILDKIDLPLLNMLQIVYLYHWHT